MKEAPASRFALSAHVTEALAESCGEDFKSRAFNAQRVWTGHGKAKPLQKEDMLEVNELEPNQLVSTSLTKGFPLWLPVESPF